MKLDRIAISNLLSFGNVELEFGGNLSVLLGPNGSGKTNLIRAIDLVGKLIDLADEQTRAISTSSPLRQMLDAYVRAKHDGAQPEAPIDLALQVAWTSASERERALAFVRAAVVATLLQNTAPHDEERRELLQTWALTEITETSIEPLFSGALIVHHPGHEGAPWDSRWRFQIGNDTVDWTLHRSNVLDSLLRAGEEARRDVAATTLWEALFGERPQTSPASPLPDRLPPFDLSRLSPAPGQRIESLVVRTGTGVFDNRLAVFRSVEQQLSMSDADGVGQRAYGLARVLRMALADALVMLGEQSRGLGVGGTVPWPMGSYRIEHLAGSVPARDPAFLPLRLFRLKNGSRAERAQFARINEEFACLIPGGALDVTFAASSTKVEGPTPVGAGHVAVPAEGESAEAVQGSLISVVVRRDGDVPGQAGVERPVELWGAGTWEALVLAEVLASGTGRVVVLDEPAVNLHPSWQRSFRRRLAVAGCRSVLITHAPDAVPLGAPSGEVRIARLGKRNGSTEIQVLDPALLRRVGVKLRDRGNARVLFAERAFLVEGRDDLDVVELLAMRAGLELDACGIALIECGSRENLPDHIRLCNELRIPYLAVMDGDQTTAQANETTAKNAQRVRDAVEQSVGALFEFREDIEHAFGLDGKDAVVLRKKAADGELLPEPQALLEAIGRAASRTA